MTIESINLFFLIDLVFFSIETTDFMIEKPGLSTNNQVFLFYCAKYLPYACRVQFIKIWDEAFAIYRHHQQKETYIFFLPAWLLQPTFNWTPYGNLQAPSLLEHQNKSIIWTTKLITDQGHLALWSIRRRSVTCNRIMFMSIRSLFRVPYQDQSDHHANSIAFVVVMNGAWSVHQGVTSPLLWWIMAASLKMRHNYFFPKMQQLSFLEFYNSLTNVCPIYCLLRVSLLDVHCSSLKHSFTVNIRLFMVLENMALPI